MQLSSHSPPIIIQNIALQVHTPSDRVIPGKGDFSTSDRQIVITLTGMQVRKYSQIKVSIITVVDNDIRSGESVVTCDLDQF